MHVLPEDRANSELANGFVLGTSPTYCAIQILNEAGGWMVLIDLFESDYVPRMRGNPNRLMVLLLDFDNDINRLEYVQSRVPLDLADRVFVIGVLTEPEDLRKHFGPHYEAIGYGLAEDCRSATSLVWGHVLLQHNSAELARLNHQVRPILFP